MTSVDPGSAATSRTEASNTKKVTDVAAKIIALDFGDGNEVYLVYNAIALDQLLRLGLVKTQPGTHFVGISGGYPM
jgi:hypothetical protein